MKTKKLNLLAYTKISSIFLLGHTQTQAQIIYKDIDPDILLDDEIEAIGLDLNENGLYDFAFIKESIGIYSTWYSETNFYRGIWAGPYTPINALAASEDYISNTYSHFYQYFPFALPLNDSINVDLSFQNWGSQRMAYWSHTYNGLAWDEKTGGNWYPEKIDQYLGVRFVDDSLKNHYGWIRCSVLDSGKVLVIKDYAYETKANHSIITGQTEYGTDIISNENQLEINLYTFHKKLFVYIREKDFLPAQLSLYSITGEKIFTEKILRENMIIDLKDFQTGIYLVELISEKGKMVKKVWVE